MKKETYERLYMDVTRFDKEDIIATSGVDPVTNNHQTDMGRFEQGVGMPIGL